MRCSEKSGGRATTASSRKAARSRSVTPSEGDRATRFSVESAGSGVVMSFAELERCRAKMRF